MENKEGKTNDKKFFEVWNFEHQLDVDELIPYNPCYFFHLSLSSCSLHFSKITSAVPYFPPFSTQVVCFIQETLVQWFIGWVIQSLRDCQSFFPSYLVVINTLMYIRETICLRNMLLKVVTTVQPCITSLSQIYNLRNQNSWLI